MHMPLVKVLFQRRSKPADATHSTKVVLTQEVDVSLPRRPVSSRVLFEVTKAISEAVNAFVDCVEAMTAPCVCPSSSLFGPPEILGPHR